MLGFLIHSRKIQTLCGFISVWLAGRHRAIHYKSSCPHPPVLRRTGSAPIVAASAARVPAGRVPCGLSVSIPGAGQMVWICRSEINFTTCALGTAYRQKTNHSSPHQANRFAKKSVRGLVIEHFNYSASHPHKSYFSHSTIIRCRTSGNSMGVYIFRLKYMKIKL